MFSQVDTFDFVNCIDSEANCFIDNKTNNQNRGEDEIEKQLENEQLEKDIIELQNDPILKEAIPVNSEESESESENENEQEGWKGRLRPRKTKITFKK